MLGNCSKLDILDLLCSLCNSSQFVEKFEEIRGVDVAPTLPSSPEFNKHQPIVVSEDIGSDQEMQVQDVNGTRSDLPTSQDFASGIMKIVPSDFDVSMTTVFEISVLWICESPETRIQIIVNYEVEGVLLQEISKCCRNVIFRNYTRNSPCVFQYMHEVFSIVSNYSSESKFLVAQPNFLSPFLQSDTDYWLSSNADVSITDMWKTERILSLNIFNLHYILFTTHTHTHLKGEV